MKKKTIHISINSLGESGGFVVLNKASLVIAGQTPANNCHGGNCTSNNCIQGNCGNCAPSCKPQT